MNSKQKQLTLPLVLLLLYFARQAYSPGLPVWLTVGLFVWNMAKMANMNQYFLIIMFQYQQLCLHVW